ncbi:hypothetical protein [Bathycoccus sp. RCC716 virus 3]|nr:hypothetical protein [Bathycoccus sp. RCC716 virus 3]|tara:strand:- start:4330 stop:4671 length:342 start_codon:yes stop_codon:yes gene_type:complete
MSTGSVPELESVDDEIVEIESESESNIEDDLSTTRGELPAVDELEDVIYSDTDIDIDDDIEYDSIDRLGNLLSSVLVNEEGETVCSALINISRQLEVQNKIMIKMLAQLQKTI